MISWPSDQVTTTIQEIINAIGREFTIYTKTSGTPCPNCLASGSYNPVTKTSTNSFCPICQGSYFLNIPSGVTLTGHVKWNTGEAPIWKPGGIVPEGDCTITVLYASGIENKIKNSVKFEVDEKILTLKNYRTRGVPTINRFIINLIQEPKG